VVVSGCASGSGRTPAGEGLLGLSHALLAAGARCVVLSRWAVTDDGAAAFMEEFYAALPGRSVGEAVHRAQSRLLASPAWRHPAHWAAFHVVGDADQRLVLSRDRRLPVLLWAGGAGLVVALAVFRRRKKRRSV
jgi:CHAT domain-containing protein